VPSLVGKLWEGRCSPSGGALRDLQKYWAWIWSTVQVLPWKKLQRFVREQIYKFRPTGNGQDLGAWVKGKEKVKRSAA